MIASSGVRYIIVYQINWSDAFILLCKWTGSSWSWCVESMDNWWTGDRVMGTQGHEAQDSKTERSSEIRQFCQISQHMLKARSFCYDKKGWQSIWKDTNGRQNNPENENTWIFWLSWAYQQDLASNSVCPPCDLILANQLCSAYSLLWAVFNFIWVPEPIMNLVQLHCALMFIMQSLQKLLEIRKVHFPITQHTL